MSMFENKKVLITGAAGICGQSAVRRFIEKENSKVRATVFNTRTLNYEHPNLEVVKADLRLYEDCKRVVEGVDVVLNFAAYIRGAKGQGDSKVDLVRNNVVPGINMIDASVNAGVEYYGFIGSSTAYPEDDHPMREEELFDGDVFHLYRGVGWMKRYQQKVIEYFQEITDTKFGIVVPMAIYGPRDNFNEHGHVIPQLIMKASEGMNPFEVWGDGTQVRTFIHVDDLIDSLIYVLETDPTATPYNVGTGVSTTITELVEEITDIYGYTPEFNYDTTKPVMIPKREIDISKVTKLGWKAKYDLRSGLEETINWYENNK